MCENDYVLNKIYLRILQQIVEQNLLTQCLTLNKIYHVLNLSQEFPI